MLIKRFLILLIFFKKVSLMEISIIKAINNKINPLEGEIDKSNNVIRDVFKDTFKGVLMDAFKITPDHLVEDHKTPFVMSLVKKPSGVIKSSGVKKVHVLKTYFDGKSLGFKRVKRSVGENDGIKGDEGNVEMRMLKGGEKRKRKDLKSDETVLNDKKKRKLGNLKNKRGIFSFFPFGPFFGSKEKKEPGFISKINTKILNTIKWGFHKLVDFVKKAINLWINKDKKKLKKPKGKKQQKHKKVKKDEDEDETNDGENENESKEEEEEVTTRRPKKPKQKKPKKKKNKKGD